MFTGNILYRAVAHRKNPSACRKANPAKTNGLLYGSRNANSVGELLIRFKGIRPPSRNKYPPIPTKKRPSRIFPAESSHLIPLR